MPPVPGGGGVRAVVGDASHTRSRPGLGALGAGRGGKDSRWRGVRRCLAVVAFAQSSATRRTLDPARAWARWGRAAAASVYLFGFELT